MSQPTRLRTTFRLKIVVLFLFLAGLALLGSGRVSREISGQSPTLTRGVSETTESLPPTELIDSFDRAIQQRFVLRPEFGIRRMLGIPVGISNPHLKHFSPDTDAEKEAVRAFTESGWDVGMYLFGRRVIRRTDTKKEKYDIRYRLFDPITVVAGKKDPDFVESKKFAEQIKQAFVDFQTKGSPNENEIRFDRGSWSYVARPVRAISQSCLQCHKDYVITERLGDGQFTARKRRLGDANGVLVYAFKRREE
jgi:hypothetical protein